MHNPLMQESLSQFMYHARSTTERHYRHHMSHKSLWPVFNELARCQNLPSEEDTMTAAPMLQDDLSPENVSISPNSTETPTVFNRGLPNCTTVVQTASDLFKPKIQPNSLGNWYFWLLFGL